MCDPEDNENPRSKLPSCLRVTLNIALDNLTDFGAIFPKNKAAPSNTISKIPKRRPRSKEQDPSPLVTSVVSAISNPSSSHHIEYDSDSGEETQKFSQTSAVADDDSIIAETPPDSQSQPPDNDVAAAVVSKKKSSSWISRNRGGDRSSSSRRSSDDTGEHHKIRMPSSDTTSKLKNALRKRQEKDNSAHQHIQHEARAGAVRRTTEEGHQGPRF